MLNVIPTYTQPEMFKLCESAAGLMPGCHQTDIDDNKSAANANMMLTGLMQDYCPRLKSFAFGRN